MLTAAALRGGAGASEPLRAALERGDAALVASLEGAVGALRGETLSRDSGLASARDAVLARLAELRASGEPHPDASAEERRQFLLQVEARQRLVARQLALEDWLRDWRTAEREGNAAQVLP